MPELSRFFWNSDTDVSRNRCTASQASFSCRISGTYCYILYRSDRTFGRRISYPSETFSRSMGRITQKRATGRLATTSSGKTSGENSTTALMIHPMHKVISFEHVAPFTLRIIFEDDSEQVIDFKPVLGGEVFGQLLDPSLFSTVRI